MLRIIGGIVAVIVLLALAVILIGSRLPVAHVATRSISLPAPPESVFATITDFVNGPSWRTDLQRVDMVTGAGDRVRFTEVSGTGPMTMQVEELTPPHRLVTRIVGDGLPFGGAWAYSVESDGSGSRITISEHGEVYNPLFRFVSRYIMGHATTLETYLTALGRKYDVAVTPEDRPAVPLR